MYRVQEGEVRQERFGGLQGCVRHGHHRIQYLQLRQQKGTRFLEISQRRKKERLRQRRRLPTASQVLSCRRGHESSEVCALVLQEDEKCERLGKGKDCEADWRRVSESPGYVLH